MATVAATALLSVWGCSKQDAQVTGFGDDPDAVRVEASVGAITRTNPLGGEASDQFSDGDKIAVSNGTKTVKYRFDGTSWAPVADDGTGATDYLVWDTPVTFRAWYPASASWDKFSLPKDQREDITAADFMTWSAEYTDDAAIPQERKLSLVMTRHMALVTIIIDKIEEQYGDLKDPEFRNAKISSAHASVYRQSDGTYRSAGVPREISPVEHEIGGKTAYSAIVTPGEADKNWGFLHGYIGNEASGYNDVYVTGLPATEAGKHYTYKLVVGKESVKIGGVTVEDWTKGSLDGKFDAESDVYSEWDGKKASSGYTFSGEGSSTSPYLIQSAADLAGLAANVNAGTNYQGSYFKLETNIDLMGREWTPIGNRERYFYGYFDGNGKVITNLTISNATDCAGLFGFADGTIQNIVLRNASVTSSSTAALLVGESGGEIKSCKVDGTVHSGFNAAGIVGESRSKVKISDCEVNVECYGGNNVGGVFGNKTDPNEAVVVKNCIARGRICGKTVGGIAGQLQGPDVISGCKSYATLSQIDKTDCTSAGGIAGVAYYSCKFEDCEVYGDIDIESENDSESFPLCVGGAIGLASEATISNLKFEGMMNVKSIKEEKRIGAVIGEVGKSLTVSSQCTYRKSGTGEFPPVGTYPEGFDITILDNIKGI